MNKSPEQKEFEWRQRRCGKITSSVLPDLMTSGRGKDELFGAKALAVMYATRYERRTGTIRESPNAKALEWGRENEPLAVEWLRQQLPFSVIKSCSQDFDEIVFNEPFDGFGDSPDAYVYNNDELTAIVEIKCPISQAKIEELQFLRAIDEKTEYYWQFLGHFIGKPEVDTLYYVIFDAYRNEGRILELHRADHEANIQKLTERINLANEIINASLRTKLEFKACSEVSLKALELKQQIELLLPQKKGNVPVMNQITRLKKQINKLYTI